MSVLVKGMEMPEICFMCPVYDGGNGCCKITLQNCLIKPDWCPLVEVPTPHGRLIDADALVEHLGDTEYKGAVKRVLMQAPVIIEAEGE